MPNLNGESIREHSMRYSALEGFMSTKSNHSTQFFFKKFTGVVFQRVCDGI